MKARERPTAGKGTQRSLGRRTPPHPTCFVLAQLPQALHLAGRHVTAQLEAGRHRGGHLLPVARHPAALRVVWGGVRWCAFCGQAEVGVSEVESTGQP